MPEMTWGQMKEEAAEQGFEKHPTGTYDQKIESAKVVDGKVYKQIQVRFVTQSGPNAGKGIVTRLVPMKNDGEVNGLFFAQMAALGFSSEWAGWNQMAQLDLAQGLEWLAPQLIGQMAVNEITHKPYNGEMRDNVEKIKSYTGTPRTGSVGPVPGTPGVPTPQSPVPGVAPGAPTPAAPQTPATAPAAPAPQAPPPAAVPVAPTPVPAAPQPQTAAPQQQVPAPPPPVTDTPDPF